MEYSDFKEQCDKWKMESNPKTDPFPYTELTTRRCYSADRGELWNDLVNFLAWVYMVDPENSNPYKERWIFRGVRNAEYSLESKLEREINLKNTLEETLKVGKKTTFINIKNTESYLLTQFKRAANQFLESSMVPDNEIEWLALMQHYGAPTRLLDFTRSPYIACFFAFEEDEGNGKCAIWAINESWFINNSSILIDHKKVTPKKLRDSSYIAKEEFKNIFLKDSVSVILPIVPLRSNQRLLVQQGLFLCSGAAQKGFFEKNLLSYKKNVKDMQKNIHKIIIDISPIRHHVLSELNFMNINRASLFPGLEGFATSLKHEIYCKSPLEIEMLKSN